MSASNIQVAIKVRPILCKEKEQKQASNWKVAGNSIQLVVGQPEPFYFDHIFDQDVSNQIIFDTVAKQIVDSGLKGFNGTIFAYGQTSSGKTYTMMGDEAQNPGVMVLATKEIFKEIEKATDRQFLLRVSYIEIYNEKIYDLLNKSNQDLKIHETPNGDVNVNCSEYIITCERELLSYLRLGSTQRKIGGTNMNERSSRSHAIFRIIIESRKTDKTDEDSVQISILNLVDLAGSERADQTGATGSRLKEGGHINKSLLFLSCVIKQLAEDKYVSYRDSKLTRILQASLGGNALTAIICTINPTAVEETLSTLSFANRAKVVKNKPQVNEVLTDAAMMKRLEKEIDRLQNALEQEKTKNSQIKVIELQKRLNEENLKIINSNSSYYLKAASDKRRRTWCPSSLTPPLVEEDSTKKDAVNSQPTTASQMPTKLQLPKPGMNFTPHITIREAYYQTQFNEIKYSPNLNEEFLPAEEVFFDEALTPRTSPSHLKVGFQTPTDAFKLRTASLTPRLTEKESLQRVERELKELEAFTNLENKLNVDHDTYNTLKYKLENAEQVIARYEKEREDFAFIKVEFYETEMNLDNCQKRCQELESKVSEFERVSEDNKDRISRYEKEVIELKNKITQLEMENRETVSLEFKYQQHKNKSKQRETELLDALEEKQKEISKLERTLQTLSLEVINKEELQQISKSLNETESVCVKCKDLQRILTENKQLTQDVEKINFDCEALQLKLEKVSSTAESEKLRADSLETENDILKKNAEHLKSCHGTLEEVQEQIASLQNVKCKLESAKIEFEVMSKETANKIAEKISISHEIQTLNTQRDTLAAECDKLLADIAANGCVRKELNELRSENTSLHSELQTIKTKLKTAQSDYVKLMTENQSKSDNYDKLNMEVLSARNQLQALQSEYRDIQQKYELIQAECNKHEGTIGEIQSEYDAIQTKYQYLQREYDKLENDSVQSIADCDRVQTQNENLETEIRELKTKVEEAQRKLLENDSLQLELESLKSEMNRLQVEYDNNLSVTAKTACPNKEENDIDLRRENAKLKHDLDNLQRQFNEMQTEYDDISTQLVDNFADYETLQSEVAKLEAELKRYTNSASAGRLAEDFEAIKVKTEQLYVENSQLTKENIEWEKTVSSMTKSMKEKCDEKEELVAQLTEMKNDSTQSESARKSIDNCAQFIQLAESFVEIEIPTENSSSRLFQARNPTKSANGSRMIISNISGLTQGMFNELRGTIEFAICTEYKSNNEIYDSLEMEDNLTSVNSCDSLEGTSSQSNEAQINEFIKEKSRLLESISELEGAIATLKTENEQLKSARMQLDTTQQIVEQLNCEKTNLSSVCDKNKCKINELNDIISRAECDNKKLIADCEQLKKTVEYECAFDGVSREIYEELKRQHQEMSEKLQATEKKAVDSVKEYDAICAKLSDQLLALHSNSVGEVILEKIKLEATKLEENSSQIESNCKCEEYRSDIFKLKTMLHLLHVQLKKINEKDDNTDIPSLHAELEENITVQHTKLQTCDGVAELNGNTQLLVEVANDKTSEYEQHICVLLEQLKQQECKCQEMQLEIIELKTSLEERIKESAEGKSKFEELNGRYTKLQAESDKLESALSSEKKKTVELEKSVLSLKEMEEECSLLKRSVACLSETISSIGNERNDIIEQKEILEKEYNTVSTKLLLLEKAHDSLKDTKSEQSELNEKLKMFQQKNLEVTEEKQKILEEMLKLEQEKKEITEEVKTLKNSESNLHEQLQKLVQDHELIVRDKEKLETEYHLSSSEMVKLKEECETNSREKLHFQQKCEELEENLKKLSADKMRLQTELEESKERQEKLKENQNTERNNLESKCSFLTSEMHVLNTTITDLESALAKAKNHSEFLLQQGKDLEEQYNLELCTVRNSNNSMAQQIEELHEKLEKADDIKLSLDKAHSEKDELILQLTNNNHSLTTKSSKLEEKSALLKEQLEESKRCLSAEVHQKEVLEKANSERDDLIIQLTNNNNSLAKKSSELEEKLAILGNQFEESKRHLSAEVDRLNQLLTEANNLSTAQISKIDDLTTKIAVLDDDLKKTQNAAAERESRKIEQIQADYNTLATKHTNLELTKSSFEAELNSARAVAIENADLVQKISELQSTLKEMQLKCSSLNVSNEELQSTNNALVKQLEDITQKTGELKLQNDKIIKLREELEKTQKDLNKSEEEQNKNLTEWKSKEHSFIEQISQLQSNIASLVLEKKSMHEQLVNAAKNSSTKITMLENKIQLLQKEQSTNLSKSISPKREKVMDENHQLKVKNMSLMEKLDSCQKSQNEERKNRRLSTHDERRLQSFWDSNRDVSTMTEPTNSECSCSELDRKLNELKQRLLIRDSQVNTLSMELKNNPLKMENATLKKLIIDEESKQHQLRQEIKKYKQLVVSRTNESRNCVKCAEASKRVIVDSAMQTTESDDSECYRKLLSKYEDLKLICRVRHVKIKELEDALSTGKENANDNISILNNQQYKQKYELLKKEFKIIREKYEEAKILCNMRYEQINNLSSQLSGNS